MGFFNRSKDILKRELNAIPVITKSYGDGIFSSNIAPTALACIDIIATAVSALPINLYRKTSSGREKVTNHPVSLILKRPNGDELYSIFWQSAINDYFKKGNIILKPYYSAEGDLVALYRLPVSNVAISRDSNGRKIFTYNDIQYNSSQIIHIPARYGYNGTVGRPVFAEYKPVFDLADALYTFFLKSYQNGVLGNKRFMVDLSEILDNSNLSANEIEIIKSKFINDYIGSQNAERPILKTLKGVEYSAIDLGGISNREAQLNESLGIIDAMICKVFNVPYEFIQGKNTYNSLEQTTQLLLDFAVRPIVQSIVEGLTNLLTLSEMDYLYIEPNYNALLRLNYNDRISGYSNLLNNGVVTINEVRAMENMPSIGPAGDIANIPANLIPLTMDVVNARLATQKLALKQIDSNNEKTGEY
jgi:HK97 family phage portal protein